MKRIAIMGCSGSGKSTLARALGAALDLPVHHLDKYYWQPDWQESDPETFTKQQREIHLSDRWIVDGGYSGFDPEELRFKRAEVLILFERSVWLCLWRVLSRVVQYRGRTRPDMGQGCPERVDWEFLSYIWQYRRKSLPKIRDRAARNGTSTVILYSDPDILALIPELVAAPRP